MNFMLVNKRFRTILFILNLNGSDCTSCLHVRVMKTPLTPTFLK